MLKQVMKHKRTWLSVLAVPVAALWLSGCSSDEDWRTTDITEIMPPLDFSLIDENGEPVEAEDFQGKATLVYFGYTQCPDVCPITLARFASAFNQLDEAEREQVQLLFISVDPQRDTPEVLKRYTGAFAPDFIGLTGERDDIDAITNRYRIAYSYEEPDSNGNYIVNHSSAVFGFDADGDAKFLVRDSHSNQDLQADLQQLIDG